MHPVRQRPKHLHESAHRHSLQQFANSVTWWTRPAAPAFSPWQVGRLTDAGKPQRQDRRVVPGFRLFARTMAGSVRSCLPQPTTQRASETLTLDNYLIDASDRTNLHRVRGDLCRPRRPKAVTRSVRQFAQRSTDRCRQ